MPSRRDFLAGTASVIGLTAGCLGSDDPVARCSSRGVGSESQHLRRVAPVTGSEQVALGVAVSEDAVQQDDYDAVVVRNRDGGLVGSIPLDQNRDMSSLSPDDHPVFESTDGELYAIPLGSPPVHGEFAVALVAPGGEQTATETIRFNCYAEDGLP